MSQFNVASASKTMRADAERNMEVILEAAVRTLAERPEASLEEIARAAGVARQTIYAHYSSRESLIKAVQQRALNDTIEVLDAAELDRGPADQALERLLDSSWRTAQQHSIFDLPAVAIGPEEQHEGHRPILERLKPLIVRGQRDGVFDRRLPAEWLVAVFIGLAHVAGDEVSARRMSDDDAYAALKQSIWRLYGIDP